MGFAENVANMASMISGQEATSRSNFLDSMTKDDTEFQNMVNDLPKPVQPTTGSPNDLATGAPAPGLGGPTAPPANVPQGGSVGNQALNIAKQYEGTPYQWGGNNLKTGVDCSGLVQQVYSRLGIHLPRVAADQAKQGIQVPANQAQPGDLVSFVEGGGVGHIGIYAGNGMMVDAPHTGDHVRLQPIAGFGVAQFNRIPGHPAPVPGGKMR